MKLYKKMVIMFMGTFIGFTGLFPVNASRKGPEKVTLSASSETQEIDEPQDQKVDVDIRLMCFATDIYDSLKNVNPELLDELKVQTEGNLFDIACSRRKRLKSEVTESVAYKELIRRYGKDLNHAELLDIAKVLESSLNIHIPRAACRSKTELLKWYDYHWNAILPFLDYIVLEDKVDDKQ